MKNRVLASALAAIVLSAPFAISAPAAADPGARQPVQLTAPDYPRGAERRGIEGNVTVRYSVDADGQVTEAEVIAADPEGVFDRVALQAVRSWTFEPAPEATTGHERQLSFSLSE